MIYFRTCAYNASKTLAITVKSVLSQTNGDFLYYICDNGSTDNGLTKAIIQDFAAKDARIVPFYNDENHNFSDTKDFLYLALNLQSQDYFCIIDSDDEYLPTFLEDCLSFMQSNNLDIVCCGNDIINAEDNNIMRVRNVNQNCIFNANEYSENFITYFPFMRTVWAKLYKAHTLKNTLWNLNAADYPLAYGSDTYINFRAFKDCNRLGIMTKSLYRYYVSQRSVSHLYHPQRVKCDQILHEQALRFLREFGEISVENYNFLQHVYFNAIADTIIVISKASCPDNDKLNDLQKIFSHEYTKELIQHNGKEYALRLSQLQQCVFDWLISPAVQSIASQKDVVANIIASMYGGILSDIDHDLLLQLIAEKNELLFCLTLKDYEKALGLVNNQALTPAYVVLLLLICKAINMSDGDLLSTYATINSKGFNVNDEVMLVIKRYPLLSTLSARLALDFCEAARLIIKGNPVKALDVFLTTENIEIDDNDTDLYFMFAQNLAAMADNIDAYLYFKKAFLSYLIESKRLTQAKAEVNELLLLMPNDEELNAINNTF